MKNYPDEKHVSLSSDDHARLLRLAEEIDGRVAELARVLARNLEVAPPWPLVEYRLQIQPAATSPINWVLHEVTFTDGSKLCHDGQKNVSCAGPCPC